MIELTHEVINSIKDKTGFTYLATPYTLYHRGISAANLMACKAAAYLINKGLNIYCPIAHSHAIAQYGDLDPLNAEFWLALDVKFLSVANGLIVLKAPGWDTSYGVSVEIENITAQNKPVYSMGWDDRCFAVQLEEPSSCVN